MKKCKAYIWEEGQKLSVVQVCDVYDEKYSFRLVPNLRATIFPSFELARKIVEEIKRKRGIKLNESKIIEV